MRRRLKAPLINLWRGLTGPSMFNQGMEPTGLHIGTSLESESAVLTPDPGTYPNPLISAPVHFASAPTAAT